MALSVAIWGGKNYEQMCGYCDQPGFSSTGFESENMTVEAYQILVDRGWRRCGNEFYKPNNERTCCPLYTIRCDAVNLQLTKSQKKVLRQVNAFLTKKASTPSLEKNIDDKGKSYSKLNETRSPQPCATGKTASDYAGKPVETLNSKLKEAMSPQSGTTSNSASRDVETPNTSKLDEPKPKCKKAKLMRLERRKARLENKGLPTDIKTEPCNKEKTLEEYINEVTPANSVRKLEVSLQRPTLDDDEAYLVYKKYQSIIHNDEQTSPMSYYYFLVHTGLLNEEDSKSAPPCGYGTFHQIYKLDGKIIAVGVLDILPKCVSSVYFFYDPDYQHLSLGTYGALRELELTRKLAETCPSLSQYYLGYYIHNCPKMRYKAQWKPSYLLCPEAYTWHPVAASQEKLDKSLYSRLNDDPNAKSEEDEVDVGEVLVLTKEDGNFRRSRLQRGHRLCDLSGNPHFDRYIKEASEFSRLVGRTGCQKIVLKLY